LGGPFNTLAQSGTAPIEKNGPEFKLCGKGIERHSLEHRIPKRKYITRIISMELCKIAKENNEPEWEKRYRNSYYCLDRIQTYNQKAYSKYCKNRCCLVCSSIRKAKYINRFLPTISTWKEPYFVTLTCKAKKRIDLKTQIKEMKKVMELILSRLNKRHSRNKGPKPMGIKALESNFNPIKQTYNPHFHLIVPSKQVAMEFILEWQDSMGDKLTDPRAQDIRPIKKTIRDLRETIKYGAKIFTDPDMIKKKEFRKKPPKIYASALHEIYKALDGSNLLTSFGFKQEIKEGEKVEPIFIVDIEEWIFDSGLTDWVNVDTGQIMTKYRPNAELEYLMNQRMDTISL